MSLFDLDRAAAVQLLRDARKLISAPGTWVKRYLRVHSRGEPTQRCMVGALLDAARPGLPTAIRDLAADLLRKASGATGCLSAWNDSHTHAEVLAAFDRAIELGSK